VNFKQRKDKKVRKASQKTSFASSIIMQFVCCGLTLAAIYCFLWWMNILTPLPFCDDHSAPDMSHLAGKHDIHGPSYCCDSPPLRLPKILTSMYTMPERCILLQRHRFGLRKRNPEIARALSYYLTFSIYSVMCSRQRQVECGQQLTWIAHSQSKHESRKYVVQRGWL
jgi:hypothetical protein